MRLKKWTKEEMLLAKDMHIAEKREKLEQNLIGKDEIKNRLDNFDDNIADK